MVFATKPEIHTPQQSRANLAKLKGSPMQNLVPVLKDIYKFNLNNTDLFKLSKEADEAFDVVRNEYASYIRTEYASDSKYIYVSILNFIH